MRAVYQLYERPTCLHSKAVKYPNRVRTWPQSGFYDGTHRRLWWWWWWSFVCQQCLLRLPVSVSSLRTRTRLVKSRQSRFFFFLVVFFAEKHAHKKQLECGQCKARNESVNDVTVKEGRVVLETAALH